MKVFYTLTIISILFFACKSIPYVQKREDCLEIINVNVKISTSRGDIVVRLYDETPIHKNNFIKLVDSGTYAGATIHRVIKDFMIMGGDPNTREGKGRFEEYTISSEFNSLFFHKKGALAAARIGNVINPGKESSGTQFYIVQGKSVSPVELKVIETEKKKENPDFSFSEEAVKHYTSIGGSPKLDNEYTIFGEVVEGLAIVDSIAMVSTDRADRPVSNIYINSVEILSYDCKKEEEIKPSSGKEKN